MRTMASSSDSVLSNRAIGFLARYVGTD
jgi:hypothetical protein